MIGDFTAPPLRRDERWTGARLQQGRVLTDQDWNLNVDATARGLQELAADVVGPSGVLAGSTAFKVSLIGGSPADLMLAAGRMWVGGLEAFAPAAFTYATQDRIAPWPSTTGRLLVYLDVFTEHVQGAEAPAAIVDPAIAPGDSTTRTRVGYRVRVVATADTDGDRVFAAMAAAAAADKPAALSIRRRPVAGSAGAGAAADPCDLPGRDAGPPDGLLRVEVLDAGSTATGTARPLRVVWSYENGGATATVVSIDQTGSQSRITLAPSDRVAFTPGDLVELSSMARRADRVDHGQLVKVDSVAPSPTGDVVTLAAAAIPAAAARVTGGFVLRRWDGEYAYGGDRAVEVMATRRGADVGVRFQAGAGSLAAGDWWTARLRAAAASPVEERFDAAPDGTQHFLAPLAFVDLAASTVVDLRRSFRPLTDQTAPAGACTVLARPGDNLQAKIDDPALANGGQLCLAAGYYSLDAPLRITKRKSLVIAGAGPGTVLHANGRTPVMMFDTCQDVEVRDLTAEGGGVVPGPGFGTLSFMACRGVRVANCDLNCPDASVSSGAACICVLQSEDGRTPSDQVNIERNRLLVGGAQRGVFVVGIGSITLAGNQVRPAGPPIAEGIRVQRVTGSLQVRDNVIDGAAIAILVDGSWTPASLLKDGGFEAMVARNVVHVVTSATNTGMVVGVWVSGFRIVHVLDTVATLTRIGADSSPPISVSAIRISGGLGPMAIVRQTTADGFDTGFLNGGANGNNPKWLWLVADLVVTGRAGARAVVDGSGNFSADRVIQ